MMDYSAGQSRLQSGAVSNEPGAVSSLKAETSPPPPINPKFTGENSFINQSFSAALEI